ncbi:MAG: MFS transporter [Rhodospirillales bacterium]|jgi:MFS family permease|nr:MFS transporter [Rhodospirillales bacterium]MDP7651863.1 MFS transporter [Rhodospirillales bacterium]
MGEETGQAGRAEVRRETKVIGLLGGAFLVHHFLQLALPPLFESIQSEFQVSYAALGGIMTAFSLASAAAQIPVGFLVDRVGARWVLMSGLGLASVALALIGATSSYTAFLALALVMGAANSACTPADYAILSNTIARNRAGRAFSLHTFAGQVGFVLAPVTMVHLATWGGWRMAVIAAGVAGLLAVLVLFFARGLLVEAPVEPSRSEVRPATNEPEKKGFALLLSPPILLFLLFFILNSSASTGIRTFSMAAMMSFHGASPAAAGWALSGYFVGTSTGVLMGGWLADRVRRYDLPMAAVVLPGVAVLVMLGGFVLPGVGLIAAVVFFGLTQGVLRPLRDVMIMLATPRGSFGKVRAFVNMGGHVGSAVIPVFLGWLLDQGEPQWVFWTIAIGILLAVATIFIVHPMIKVER